MIQALSKRKPLLTLLLVLLLVVVGAGVYFGTRGPSMPHGYGALEGSRDTIGNILTAPNNDALKELEKHQPTSFPFPGKVSIHNADMSVVKSVTTPKNGKFRFVVPAGTYTLDGGCGSKSVVITAEQTTHETLLCPK